MTGIEAQGGIALIASAEGREILSLSLQGAFQAQVTGSLPGCSAQSWSSAEILLLCLLQLANPNFFPPPVPIVSSDKQGPSGQLKLSINNL